MQVLSIASPLLKCVLPDAGPIDERFQQDMFGSTYTFADQPRLTGRAFEIAEAAGARIIRVFSYWRTVDPRAGTIVSPARCATSPTRRSHAASSSAWKTSTRAMSGQPPRPRRCLPRSNIRR